MGFSLLLTFSPSLGLSGPPLFWPGFFSTRFLVSDGRHGVRSGPYHAIPSLAPEAPPSLSNLFPFFVGGFDFFFPFRPTGIFFSPSHPAPFPPPPKSLSLCLSPGVLPNPHFFPFFFESSATLMFPPLVTLEGHLSACLCLLFFPTLHKAPFPNRWIEGWMKYHPNGGLSWYYSVAPQSNVKLLKALLLIFCPVTSLSPTDAALLFVWGIARYLPKPPLVFFPRCSNFSSLFGVFLVVSFSFFFFPPSVPRTVFFFFFFFPPSP